MAKEASGKIKKKATSRKWEAYTVNSQKATRKNKFCPKCGDGVFLAAHKERLYCGCCHYTEFSKR